MEVLMNERLDAMQSAIDAFIATISTSTLVATPGPERVLPNLLAADERLQAALVLRASSLSFILSPTQTC